MTRDDYESLVKRLEQEAALNPSGYRRRLGALALLGYGYIAVAVAVLVCACVLIGWFSATSGAIFMVVKKTGWALAALGFVASKTLSVRAAPPQGYRLTRGRCPQLFSLIDQVRGKLRAPRADRVLLTGDFNAAIVQHPRMGYLLGSRNYLLLGLPLMQCLSAEEFEAVIAHELGHLSGAHGRFGAWIYRIRMSWNRLQSQPLWNTRLFNRFLNWYGPLFNAYSFVQARQQEYEADRMSVEVVGAAPTAAALLRVCREGEFLGETFWPSVFRRADEEPIPSLSPFTLLGTALRQPEAGSRADWLERALSQRTGHADTHPCLADRLQAIGTTAQEPAPVQVSAAEALLGAAHEPLKRELDEGWRSRVKNWWLKRHQYAADSRARLAALEQKARTEPLMSEEELWERARLTEEFSCGDLAMSLYQQLLERNSHHVGALWRLGQMLLARDDARGVEQVSAAARIDPTLEQSACTAVVGYHRRHGREAEAKECERRAWRMESGLGEARRERFTVHARDRFIAHGLEAATVAELARRLETLGVAQALLVRKQLKRQPERSVLVLAVRSRTPWWRRLDPGVEKQLTSRVGRECRLLPEMLVVSLHLAGGLRRPLQRVSGSQIYRRCGR